VAHLLSRETPPRTLSASARERLIAAMPTLKERAKTLLELAASAEFLFTDGARPLDDAAAKVLSEDARRSLGEFLATISDTDWTGPALEEKARAFAEAKGLKLGQVAQPLRAALTGKTTSPPIFAMLEVLGREESVNRLAAHVL
jgi:glutamyl-tRNA synthetase